MSSEDNKKSLFSGKNYLIILIMVIRYHKTKNLITQIMLRNGMYIGIQYLLILMFPIIGN
jgi:hypothetical protein